ncbi:hypothetical protein KFE25_004461 [Diacronema lutheri]|uniref:Uncharacterized protein n=1 Tax=Diacronema lutheri TaxID=2081491 RepID=A0A8J5XB20_DIALT|nr:hypothetical protein KFE25_004461 [Diacronema lutheri]
MSTLEVDVMKEDDLFAPDEILIPVDTDSFAAGMLVGLFAHALDDVPGGGPRGGPRGIETVGHVLVNGACIEGRGSARALNALYEPLFAHVSGASAGLRGPCPRATFGDDQGAGAYVTFFPALSDA